MLIGSLTITEKVSYKKKATLKDIGIYRGDFWWMPCSRKASPHMLLVGLLEKDYGKQVDNFFTFHYRYIVLIKLLAGRPI